MMDESENSALATLRGQLAELESEVAAIEHRLDQVRAAQRAVEERAMAAIRAGDDLVAKRALMEMIPHAEAAVPLEADLKVVRAMADACRWFLESAATDHA